MKITVSSVLISLRFPVHAMRRLATVFSVYTIPKELNVKTVSKDSGEMPRIDSVRGEERVIRVRWMG